MSETAQTGEYAHLTQSISCWLIENHTQPDLGIVFASAFSNDLSKEAQFHLRRKIMTTILIAVGGASSLMFFLFFIIRILPNEGRVQSGYQQLAERPHNKSGQLSSHAR